MGAFRLGIDSRAMPKSISTVCGSLPSAKEESLEGLKQTSQGALLNLLPDVLIIENFSRKCQGSQAFQCAHSSL